MTTIRPSTLRPVVPLRPQLSITAKGFSFNKDATLMMAVNTESKYLFEQHGEKLYIFDTTEKDAFKVQRVNEKYRAFASAPRLLAYLTGKTKGMQTYEIGEFKDGMRQLKIKK